MRRWLVLVVGALALSACASGPVNEMPAAATVPAAAPPATGEAPSTGPVNAEGLPLERHEASALCWMRYDRTPGTLEAKAKLVDKCITDKMAGVDNDPKKKPAR